MISVQTVSLSIFNLSERSLFNVDGRAFNCGHFSLIFTVTAFFCYWKLSGYAVKDLRPMSWKLRPVIALLVIAVAF